MTLSQILASCYKRDDHSRVWVPQIGSAQFNYSDGAEIEEGLLRFVSNCKDRSSHSPELAEGIVDWPTRYHLSPERANLLAPLKNALQGRVLELGAGCGAISRCVGEFGAEVLAVEGSLARAQVAAERCADLLNVAIVADQIGALPDVGNFDCVLLVGVLEYSRRFPCPNGPRSSHADAVQRLLEYASSFLAPSGVLIVAIENQLGLKYFAGAPEDHTGAQYLGIEDRYQQDSAVTFGRHELSKRLQDATLSYQQFFYPLPDYKLPTIVLHEEFFEKEVGSHMSSALYDADDKQPAHSTRNFDEQRVWAPLLRNKIARDLANSFLVCASSTPLSSTWTNSEKTYFDYR